MLQGGDARIETHAPDRTPSLAPVGRASVRRIDDHLLAVRGSCEVSPHSASIPATELSYTLALPAPRPAKSTAVTDGPRMIVVSFASSSCGDLLCTPASTALFCAPHAHRSPTAACQHVGLCEREVTHAPSPHPQAVFTEQKFDAMDELRMQVQRIVADAVSQPKLNREEITWLANERAALEAAQRRLDEERTRLHEQRTALELRARDLDARAHSIDKVREQQTARDRALTLCSATRGAD